MTNAELITILLQLPPEGVVLIYDSVGDLCEVDSVKSENIYRETLPISRTNWYSRVAPDYGVNYTVIDATIIEE